VVAVEETDGEGAIAALSAAAAGALVGALAGTAGPTSTVGAAAG
jgi:hypothetical protein